jgi:hypothetical protein
MIACRLPVAVDHFVGRQYDAPDDGVSTATASDKCRPPMLMTARGERAVFVVLRAVRSSPGRTIHIGPSAD